ncbi:MAG: hypothetical protein J0L82_12210 [Deltaproteobacteria bacterium]|nr:hypothetical protein [Deltaproteobacteria bacterium]
MRSGIVIFTFFILNGFVSTSYSGACDGRMDDALWERGVCAGDRCSLGVADGKLISLPGKGGAGFQKLSVTNLGSFSSVEIPKELYSNDLPKPKVTSVQIAKGNRGNSTLTMFTQESSSAKRRVEYRMTSDGTECTVDQISESDAASDISSVKYDKEFCDGAENAFKGMDAAAAQACQGAIAGLEKLYETRSAALKDEKKQFAAEAPTGVGDSVRSWAAGKISPKNKGLFERAMEQRDDCARPLGKLKVAEMLKQFDATINFNVKRLNMDYFYKHNLTDLADLDKKPFTKPKKVGQ